VKGIPQGRYPGIQAGSGETGYGREVIGCGGIKTLRLALEYNT